MKTVMLMSMIFMTLNLMAGQNKMVRGQIRPVVIPQVVTLQTNFDQSQSEREFNISANDSQLIVYSSIEIIDGVEVTSFVSL